MVTEKKALLSLVDRFKDVRVLVAGDLVLDKYIWGEVDRISPEAPVVVVRQTEESVRLGGAGNVAHNIVSLGAQVVLCGVVGDDENGRAMIAQVEALGIDSDGVLIDRSRPTTVKTRVIARAQQVVRVDRESLEPIGITYQEGIGAQLHSRLGDVQGVVISDYAKGAVCPALFKNVEKGYEEGRLGAGKIPVVVDPKAPNFVNYSRSTVIKPNRSEAEQASGVIIKSKEDALAAGRKLLELWNTEMVLITLGDLGMVLVSSEALGSEVVNVDTVAREVYDVSGAGDTVSAVFTLALSAGATPEEAAHLANFAAGIVVAEVGTAAVQLEELREAIQNGRLA